ncbi:MAG: EpsI family protein [Gammaproteobacteria bacterium]|nr:EpsI family protein [Gammaproteobacteria bacterium]
MEEGLRRRDAWRVAGKATVALLLLTFFLYQQTIVYLVESWNQIETGEYGHGYLVLLISVYLIFYNRQRLMALAPCPDYRAIFAVLATSMLWMLAVLVDVEMLQTVGLLLLVLSILYTLLGVRVARILTFPVLYIGFAIPIWFPLSPLLQELTADVVFMVIRQMEVPALRVENMIVLPAGKLLIEEACSGLSYFLSALTLGAFFAYINYATFSARLIVVLVAACAAVLTNILRVFIVVYLGYTTDMQHPLVSDHLAFGWYLFGGVVIVLLVIETLLHNSNAAQGVVVYKLAPCNKAKSQFVVIALMIALIVSASSAIVFRAKSQLQPIGNSSQIKLPLNVGEWSVVDVGEDDWTPQYRGATNHKVLFQDKNNQEVSLYIGIYHAQSQGKELINDLNKISDNKVWHTRYQRARLYNAGGQQVLEQLLEKDDGSQRLVWYWYHVAGRNTVNKYQAKMLEVLGLFNGKRQASVIAIAAKLDGEPEHVREMLGDFAVEVKPSLIMLIDDNK